jgi:drug/metabolite transporter (DMT)-like permease
MELTALGALFAGALCTGSASILVRLSETGPTATAFWRGCLALPLLALWALFETRGSASGADARKVPDLRANVAAVLGGFRDSGFIWAGVFFAGDLALWHWSLLLTSVAAATLEASLAPLIVTFIVWVFWRERPTAGFLAATAFAMVGMALMVSPKFGLGGSAFVGDALGVGTAVFFAGYLLVVARLRASYGTGTVMFNSTLVFTVLLLPLALSQKLVPDTPRGWAIIAGCAVQAHVLGQGLIAYALAHLRPTFSSLGLLIQAFGAAVSAWLVLGERISLPQIIGALIIVAAIAMARSAAAAPAPSSRTSFGVIRD